MKVNLHMLINDLGSIVSYARHTKDRLARTIEKPGIYPDNGALDPGTLYIVPADAQLDTTRFPRASRRTANIPSLILLNRAHADLLPDCVEYVIADDADMASVLDRLVGAFARYSKWELDLSRAVMEDRPVEELGLISRKIFGKPVILYDRFYQTLFYAHGNHERNIVPARPINDAIPDWELSEVRAKSSFFEARIPYSSQRFREQFGYSHLCYNLFSGDERIGILAIHESERQIEDRDWALIKFLGDFLAHAVIGSAEQNISVSGRLNILLGELADGKPVEEGELANSLSDIGWPIEGDYVCVSLVDESAARSSRTLHKTASSVTNAISGIVAVVRDSAITFVCNTQKNPLPVPDIVEAISTSAKGGFDVIGVSTHFHSLTDFGTFRRYSLGAVSMGKRCGDQGPVHYYDDHIIEQMLAAGTGFIDRKAIVPREITLLERHDRGHGTDLAGFLEVYLKHERSIAATSRALHLHRNTTLSRATKVREVIGSDLNDPAVRLRILVAYAAQS